MMQTGLKRILQSANLRLSEAYDRTVGAYRLSKLPKTYGRGEFQRAREEAIEQYRRCRATASEQENLTHPVWEKWRQSFRVALEEGLPEAFLNHPVLLHSMVRQGYGQDQLDEENYLRECSPFARRTIDSIRESFAGRPRIDVASRGWSATTLGHAYYLARMIDLLGVGQQTAADVVMEFGGGYGNLCRIFRQSLSNSTYILVDLPEFLALQLMFLRLSLPSETIKFITGDGDALAEGAINLVPVGSWQRVDIKPDLFLSTFALSESPAPVQRAAVERRFFKARAVYLVGQHRTNGLQSDDVWQNLDIDAPWQDSAVLIDGVRDCYSQVRVNPFHIGDNYEMAATVPQ